MRIKPLGWRVLVAPNKAEEGAVVPDELKKLGFEVKQGMDADEIRRSVLSLEVGVIVDIGPLAWMRQDMQGDRAQMMWRPWAKIGDKVTFNRYAGKLLRDPDAPEYYLLLNDEDILVIEEPKGAVK